jgi:hypothetical protein
MRNPRALVPQKSVTPAASTQTRTTNAQNQLPTLQNGTNTAIALTYDNNGNLLRDDDETGTDDETER